MTNTTNIQNTFGLKVLFKFLKKTHPEIEIQDTGDRLIINTSLEELDRIVSKVMEDNDIKLEIR